MNRKWNFSAGPAVLPVEVLESVQRDMVDFRGAGLSLIESSHRTPLYEDIHQETMGLVRSLLGVPEGYHILFLGGGATMQFGMIPLNLMGRRECAGYVNSGAWAQKAMQDARTIGEVQELWSGWEDKFTTLPRVEDLKFSENLSYIHITSNETIGGIGWNEYPDTGEVPLVADMSSDILSRPLDVGKFGLIYAGAQKNIGPAGVTMVILRESLLQEMNKSLPAYLSYKTHADKNSLYNTPPVFPIYAVNLVLKWLKEKGGVEGIARTNRKKASIVYNSIDNSREFYFSPVDRRCRSLMNVIFRLPSEELESRFVREASQQGMIGLKGHRSVGGCRASLYNAMPLEGANCLGDFMQDFARKYG